MPGEMTLLHVERVLLLKKTPPLDTLPSPLLALVAEYARERFVPAGTVLLKPGEPVSAIYFVADGRVRVRANEQEFLLASRGTGVGGLGLLGRTDEGVEAVAETDALVLALEADTVHELFEENFAIFHHILRGLSRQLVQLRIALPEVSLAVAPPLVPVNGGERELDFVERIFFLRKLSPFAASSINSLAELARGLNQMRFDAGVTLWSEGDPSRAIFIILSGRVACHSSRGRGAPSGPGAPLGGLEAMGELPRWHDAITETPVVALATDVEMLLDVFEDNVSMGLDYLALVAAWISRIFARVPNNEIARQYFGLSPTDPLV
jgi:CRP-like cAMP-binding protein